LRQALVADKLEEAQLELAPRDGGSDGAVGEHVGEPRHAAPPAVPRDQPIER
jgi:hypothetical protein